MSALSSLRLRLNTAVALGAVCLVAIALTVFRLDVPNIIPGFELLMFGWLGVALGRLAVGAGPAPEPKNGARDDGARSERVDHILRSIARLLQIHLTDSEAFSERLRGASVRLSQHESGGQLNEIVMALIEDNREMRDRTTSLRDQLEDSRLQVLQLRNDLERSEEAGQRDIVTLIGNRRYFETALAEELEKARRIGDDFCLAIADLDRFKLINDRFGHLVGDRLLRLFAEILTQNARSKDRIARFGGEEFAVLLPGARLGEAVEAVDRMRRVLESKQWTIEPSGERIGKVTVSFGVAKFRPNESGAELLRRADANLYDAKSRGRNCVVAESLEDAPRTHRQSRSRRVANA
jgi:diguanylate cyclase